MHFCDAFGAKVAEASLDGAWDDGVLSAAFCADFASVAYTPAAADAGSASVIGDRVAQHRDVKRVKAEAFGGRLEDLEAAIGREWRHGQGALSRSTKDVIGVVAGDTDFPLGFFVVRLEIPVVDGPVFEGAALDGTILSAQAEVVFHEAPSHGAVAEGASADACCIVAVGPMARVDGEFAACLVDVNAWIALAGAEGISENAGALVAEVVFAVVEGRVPLAAFEEHN